MIRFWRAQRGATALEFALISPLVLILLLGTIDVSMETLLDSALEHGAQSAARIGVTVSTTDGVSRSQAVYNEVWSWVSPWLQNQSQLTVSTVTYPAYSDIGMPEPCGDDSYAKTGTCTGSYTDVNGNGHWDDDMGASGLGGYGSIVRYRFTVTRPMFTGILQLLGINLFTLQRTVVLQNEPQNSQGK
jgi:Flp pilus assembly pilin Flp